MSKKPEYLYSRLTLTGSDDVDELIRRCKGDYQQAESILHAMLNNYLHFQSMQREKDLGALHRLQVEQRHVREEIREMSASPMVSNSAFSARAQPKFERIDKVQEEIEKLIDKLEEKAARPGQMKGPVAWGRVNT